MSCLDDLHNPLLLPTGDSPMKQTQLHPSSDALHNDAAHRSTPPISKRELLGWEELRDLIPELPHDPCQRAQLLSSLYLDGLCAPEVSEELDAHLESCQDCTRYYQQLTSFNTAFVESFDELESSVSQADAEASLRHLFTERWDELDLEELDLDETRDRVLGARTEEVGLPGLRIVHTDEASSDLGRPSRRIFRSKR